MFAYFKQKSFFSCNIRGRTCSRARAPFTDIAGVATRAIAASPACRSALTFGFPCTCRSTSATRRQLVVPVGCKRDTRRSAGRARFVIRNILNVTERNWTASLVTRWPRARTSLCTSSSFSFSPSHSLVCSTKRPPFLRRSQFTGG